MSTNPLRTKRLTGEYNKILKNGPIPNILARPDPDNMLIWYYVVYGLKDCPYEDGVYFGRIELPEKYPLEPPAFKMHTPSGRFETDSLICTSISNFHHESWSSSWNVETAVLGLLSFMLDDHDSGFGSIKSSKEERKALAKKSLKFNLTNDHEVHAKDPSPKKWNYVFKTVFPEFSSGDLKESMKAIGDLLEKYKKPEPPKETTASKESIAVEQLPSVPAPSIAVPVASKTPVLEQLQLPKEIPKETETQDKIKKLKKEFKQLETLKEAIAKQDELNELNGMPVAKPAPLVSVGSEISVQQASEEKKKKRVPKKKASSSE